VILAVLAVLAGAFVQSATGFGFALVASPALLAVLEPRAAVLAILALGALLNVLLLFGERRRREVRGGEVARLLAGAAPGVAAGLLVLEALAKPALQLLVGAVVVAAGVGQGRAPRGRPRRVPPAGGAYGVGLLSGALTTSTGVNGPPLVLWLRARGAAQGALRDSVTATLLCLSPLGLAVLLATGPVRLDLGVASAAGLALAAAVGHYAGRQAFLRLGPRHYGRAVLALVLATGAASIAAGVAGLVGD
jgi:uncharacterized membrane protein YfcA